MPATTPNPNPSEGDGPKLSWRVEILPFLEQLELYDQFKHDEPWDSPHNLKLIDQMPQVYASLSHPLEPGKTMIRVPYSNVTDAQSQKRSAVFIAGTLGPRLSSVTDGTSNTIGIIEVNPDAAVIWTKPDEWEFDPDDPLRDLGRAHPNRILVSFCDGAVRAIDPATSREEIKRMFTVRASD